MKERPILFSGPMVLAILEGRKTQTRRVVKPQPTSLRGSKKPWCNYEELLQTCPYGQPGDRLWVREAFAHRYAVVPNGKIEHYFYRADREQNIWVKWRPSIHMPRWASRITLEIVAVRVERLNSINHRDAIAEGVERLPPNKFTNYIGRQYSMGLKLNSAEESYQTLWESINGSGSWEANPFVWVLEFKRATREAKE